MTQQRRSAMKKCAVLIGAMLVLAVQVALAQAPTPPDTSATPTQTPPPAVAPPVTPPPAATPAPPPPAPAQTSAGASSPKAYRYGSISGSWLKPTGDFETFAKDGWAITLEGYQFLTPNRKVAIGS